MRGLSLTALKDNTLLYFWKIVRYGLAAVGGVLLKEGYVNGEQLDLIFGATTTLVTIGASVYQSRARAKRLGVTAEEYSNGY